ncbi:MAG: metal ABC transporter permease [Ktedonobacterales bacterium]|nr:metal ABC transporter permease [Ktedonobacterales bacterium]
MVLMTHSVTLPPFSLNLWFDFQTMGTYPFMRAAFLAGTPLSLAAGAVGYFVVLRRVAFAGDALAHVAFAGVLAAVVFRINPYLGLYGGTVLVALGMGALGERARGRDTVIGTVLAWVLGLGVLCLSLYAKHATNSTFGLYALFGGLIGLTQAITAAVVGGAVVLGLLVIARPLLFVSLDPDVAVARRVPVRLLGVLFMGLLAIVVGQATQAVGALMVFVLLVTPAAIAQHVTVRPYRALALAALLALLFTWVGITLSFYTVLPVSTAVSGLAFLSYFAVRLARQPRPGVGASHGTSQG